MKRYGLVFVMVFGSMSLAWAEPPIKQVEVVNEYLNVDIQNEPVDVNVMNEPDTTRDVRVVNTEYNPIPVVNVNGGGCEKEYFTAYAYLEMDTTTTLVEVPQGKRALVKDIIVDWPTRFKLLFGGNMFVNFDASYGNVINLASGLVTPLGPSTIEAQSLSTGHEYNITIAGYFIPE